MLAMTVTVMMMTLTFNEMLTMTFTLGSDAKKTCIMAIRVVMLAMIVTE
jgi:hypothetical protein